MRLRYQRLYSFKESQGFYLKNAVTALLLLATLSTYFLLNKEAQTVRNARQDAPVIVLWTNFFKESLKKMLLPTLQNCEYQCELMDRTEHEIFNRSAAAFILHGRNMNHNDLPAQSSEHLNVFFLLESPFHTGPEMYRVPGDYFNATMTYRLDSRYFYPYGHFQPRSPSDTVDIITNDQLVTAVKRKKKGSLIFVSNCRTPSKREEIIRKLGKFTEVTVRGKCEKALSVNKNARRISCKTECSDGALIAKHRFYIAFENSNCLDYVTEKYFDRISQLLVPVVMKRQIYEDAGLPKDSFVALDDFNSPEDLGNYLNILRKNDTEYLRYFEWTKHFRKPNAYVGNALCRLCEDIYKGKRLKVNDIKEYYEKDKCF